MLPSARPPQTPTERKTVFVSMKFCVVYLFPIPTPSRFLVLPHQQFFPQSNDMKVALLYAFRDQPSISAFAGGVVVVILQHPNSPAEKKANLEQIGVSYMVSKQ